MRVNARFLVGCLLGAALTGSLAAQEQDVKGGNPFLPENYRQQDQAEAAPEPVRANPLDKLELRGITNLGKVQSFSIYDTAISKGFWVKLNETVQGVSVSDFDKSDESVLVRSGGFSKRLKLKEAKIVALEVQAPAAQAARAPAGAAAAGATPGMNMTTGTATMNGAKTPPINNLSDDEVRARMQRVAEEIRRRRAMRREMAEEAAAQKKP